MMVVDGGRERTKAKYRALAAAAGLGISRVLPVPRVPDHVLMECVTAG